MTVKEYNTIGRAAYEAAIKIPDVQEVLDHNSVAMIYDTREDQKHEIWTVAHSSQVNGETLREHGFTKNAQCVPVMWLNRQTKCAYMESVK